MPLPLNTVSDATPAASAAGVGVRLWWMIGLCTVLGLGHHIDHVLRDATGWPMRGHAVGPFTFSLRRGVHRVTPAGRGRTAAA